MAFCVGWNEDVLHVEHSPKQFKLFTDVNYQIRHQFITQVLKPKSLLQCLLMKFCFMNLTSVLECFLCLCKHMNTVQPLF